MSNLHEILEKYWGFTSFRPLQEEIINSVMQGNDTLALLPTGGGKSICFQVPALAQEGICLVVSPLIALMKDQVENLVSKDIKAIAINSTMHKREIDIALDNCIYGHIKFLYLSPERLESEIVKVRLQKMNINLIAIDESHCISHWGYDFRPSYLKLSELKQILPNIPILALTATATKEVILDIQEKLEFKKPNVFRKSFERKNLSYVVLKAEDKLARLLKIVNGIKGQGIIYARNRKKTQEIAEYLRSNNISADFYHAGLDPKKRSDKQNNWMQNLTRIIVCTNAFGMGIDKANVRFIIHIDIPDSVEAYFQEAGRAGRDEKKAYAILLFNKGDRLDLQRNLEISYPSLDVIRQTYQALSNYYQLATGAGLGVTFDFDIAAFCDTYKLNAITVFHCLKFIEREGYISLSDAFLQPSRVKLEYNRDDLYKFQIQNETYDNFIKLLLRSYAGLFENFVKISEYDLAKKANTREENIVKRLNYLNENKIITYFPQTTLPQLTFTMERIDANRINFSNENYAMLKERSNERMETILHYAESNHKCRSQLLLAYFDEHETVPCGQCDVCLEEKRKALNQEEFEKISNQVRELLAIKPMDLKALINSITESNEDRILHTINWMIDNKQLRYNEENLLCFV